MRQQSKQELAKSNARLQAELDRVHEALGAVMGGNAVLVGQFTLDGQTTKARLIGADRAHGGLVMFSETTKDGARAMHRVHYLEEQERELRHAGTDYARNLRNLVGKARTEAWRKRHAPKETIVDVAVRAMMPSQDGQHGIKCEDCCDNPACCAGHDAR